MANLSPAHGGLGYGDIGEVPTDAVDALVELRLVAIVTPDSAAGRRGKSDPAPEPPPAA
jgi:hypothetical protein